MFLECSESSGASSIAFNLAMFSDVKCFQKGGGAGKGAFGSGRCWSAMAAIDLKSTIDIKIQSACPFVSCDFGV